MNSKNKICLWYENDAEAAANFYASIFPDSKIIRIVHAPADYPGGREGDLITVEFSVFGVQCIGLNGGSFYKQNEAFSFQIATENQEETDKYWNAIISNGGSESVCGWCKDRWGVSWQISPRILIEAIASGGEIAKRAFYAMIEMKKIDISVIEKAILTGPK
jgi:predicted 3-demethylubiquinone-9 3-methyltransferase (glyoxalase superfamily)